jgi:hypothetical protein
MLEKIKNMMNPSISFEKLYEEISKNPKVTLLSLDPTETHLKLFHHPQIVGGSWISPDTKLVAALGFDSNAKPIQFVSKSIKDFKCKSFSTDEFAAAVEDLETLKKLKNAHQEISYKNIVAIPHLLTQVFLSLESTDPLTVAMAFFHALYEHDSSLDDNTNNDCHSVDIYEPQEHNEPNLEEEISTGDQSQNETCYAPQKIGKKRSQVSLA